MGGKALIKPCSFTLKIICLCLLILVSDTTASSNSTCPFQYVFHFGDGVTDIGNSIHVKPKLMRAIPAARPPYGRTYPGYPTGRWSDGRIDFDFTAEDFGLPNIVAYLTMDRSRTASYDGVIFSVARSPVLDRNFFGKRNISITSYAVPLREQLSWFKNLLKSVCQTRWECAQWIGNSLVLMGDIEGNDIGYALTQGKSIQEVMFYVPFIVKTIMDTTREIIKLGARRVIIPGNGPLGCYPYILTALQTNDTTAYDELGCLKSVNDFTIFKNEYLELAIEDLRNEFPEVQILFGPMYDGMRSLIANASVIGNSALKSCCGVGGKYNYHPMRFCGTRGVPVCKNPNEYIFWDGVHYTQQTQWEAEDMLVRPALEKLKCKPLPSAFLRPKRGKINSVLTTYVSSY
ncbi:acetylajmalan esterase [Phtheirospermum japonicum]|uniref:Acetylajmalan esterase n=1 Tax=Phtheirospermum japonicum TaxID=374723 RepID=A0A830C8K7_9LAMI|nr:acetylajmalan esterase [Phtheirospermum japonicum]